MAEAVGETEAVAVEMFGVRIAFDASDPGLFARIVQLVPSQAKPCSIDTAGTRFSLLAEPGVGYRVVLGDAGQETCAGLELALIMLGTAVDAHIASNARELVFIRAGVVVDRSHAIVLPGPSFSGKTTLVEALVERGLEYYSDEYAVLDSSGLVLPYARSQIRPGLPGVVPGWRPDETNRSIGDRRSPVALIAVVPYRPQAQWQWTQRSVGEGMLMLLQNAIPVGIRPAETMQAARHAVAAARVVVGERGEAADAAEALIGLSSELRA